MKRSYVRMALALLSTSVIAVAILTGAYYFLSLGNEVNNSSSIMDSVDYTSVMTANQPNTESVENSTEILPKEIDYRVFLDYKFIKLTTNEEIIIYNGLYYISLDLLVDVLGFEYNLEVEEGVFVIHNEEYELVLRLNSDGIIRSSIYNGETPFFYKFINYTYGVDDQLFIPMTSIATAFGVKVDINDINNVNLETIDYLYSRDSQRLKLLGYDFIEENRLLLYNKAIFLENGKKGIITSEGKIMVPAVFDDFTELYQDVFLVKKDNRYGLYSFKGETLLDTEYEKISLIDPYNKLLMVKNNGKMGLANQNGKFVIDVEYDEIGTTSLTGLEVGMEESSLILSDCITVKKNGKYGIMSIRGEQVLPPTYDEIGYIHKNNDNTGDEFYLELYGLDAVVVGVNGFYGAVNREGQLVIPIQYKSIFLGENGWEFE